MGREGRFFDLVEEYQGRRWGMPVKRWGETGGTGERLGRIEENAGGEKRGEAGERVFLPGLMLAICLKGISFRYGL